MRISKRLKTIANMVDDNASIIDVGCDHALLPIYLVKEKNVKAIASDVNSNALNMAKENIKKYNLTDKIETVLTDGVRGIDITDKTIIICGMGSRTICNIINDITDYTMKDLIIQSNHEIEYLRRFMVQKGFKIIDERFLIDRHKPYTLIKFKKGIANYSYIDFMVGPYLKNNLEYVEHIINGKINVLSCIPRQHFIKRYRLKKEVRRISKLLDI